MDIVPGIVGAIVGGFILSAFGAIGVTGFNLYGMVVAIFGGIIVLAIYHAIFGRKTNRPSAPRGASTPSPWAGLMRWSALSPLASCGGCGWC